MSNEVDRLKARLDFIHNRCMDIKIVLDELKDRILRVDDSRDTSQGVSVWCGRPRTDEADQNNKQGRNRK